MLTLVVGGQYGGEGKGKVCAFLGRDLQYDYVCRTGGVNSSHTVVDRGRKWRLRMMPASCVVSRSPTVLFGAGSLLHLPTLFEEAALLGYDLSKIVIDPHAGVITEDIIERQRSDPRYAHIGSTLTGTGYATAARAMRELPLAMSIPSLRPHLQDVADILDGALRNRNSVLVEGHQGMGLSNYHGDYPFTSSRDCTSSALLSEIGVGPRAPLRIILAIKLFPTRNHAGALPNEMPEHEANSLGVYEFGGGSWNIADRRRRVGIFDIREVRRAVRLNSATCIALTGFDYLHPHLKDCSSLEELPVDVRDHLDSLSDLFGAPIAFVSTGPETNSMMTQPTRSSEETNWRWHEKH